MKRTFTATAVAIGFATLLSFGTKADAAIINITNDLGDPAALLDDFPKGDLSSVGNAVVYKYLVATVAAHNNTFATGLPDPVGGGADGYDPLASFSDSSGPFEASLYTYAVAHYGVGRGGVSGTGGGLVVYYLNGMSGMMSLPDDGNGPTGYGGISFVRLYGPGGSVPDNGMTLVLLGLGLGVMGLFAKFKPAKA